MKKVLKKTLPHISLTSTSGEEIDFSTLKNAIIFCVPRPSSHLEKTPENWSEIPGAKGCTPQSKSFRDNYLAIKKLGLEVYGLSVQTTDYQKEVKERLCLPFDFLSDVQGRFFQALDLDMLQVGELHLIKRISFIIQNGEISKVFYPILEPEKNVEEILEFICK